MADFLTPDGRLVSVPDGLIGQFQGLTPAPPMPPIAPVGGDPDFAPADTAALAALTPPPTDAPITAPSQLPPPEQAAPQRPVGAVVAPAELVEPGPPNTPKPITDRSLMASGETGPMNATLGAMDEQKVAAQRLGEAQAAQAAAVGQIETAANDAADRQLAKMQADAEAHAKAVQDATDLYLQNATKLANTRIDHGIDHPVMAAIGTAMNILGKALAHQPMTDVMKPVYEAVDRKVAAQMQDLEQGRANLGLQRTGLDMLRQSGNDRAQLQNTFLLAGLEQAKRRVQQIKDQTQSPIVRAQTDLALADIDIKQGELLARTQASIQQRMDAQAARAQAERLARAQMGVTMRGQNLEAEAKRDELAARIVLAKGDAAAQAKSKGDIKLAEDIQKRAIGGEITPVKDEKGEVTGYDVGLIKQKKTGEIWLPNGTEATISELQKQHPAAAALVGTIDEIRRLGPEWLLNTANTDKKQKLDQLFSTAKTQATAVLGLGVPTGRDIELATGSLGTTDPTRFRDSLAGLNQARNTFVRVHNERLRSAGLDHDWAPVDTGNVGTESKPGDEIRKLLLSKPDLENEAGKLLDKKRAGLIGTEKTDEFKYLKNMQDAVSEYRQRYDRGASLDQQDAIEKLRSDSIGTGPDAKTAIDILKEVAKNGATESIRKRAADALVNPVPGSAAPAEIPDVLRLR